MMVAPPKDQDIGDFSPSCDMGPPAVQFGVLGLQRLSGG
jgi:hypothetical protein